MKEAKWDPADAAYLRNIFSQPSGQRFLQQIKRAIPRVSVTDNMEKVGIEALKKQGAEDLFEFILGLGNMEPDLVEGRDYVDLTKEGD